MFYVYVAFQKKICKIYQLCCNRKVTNLKQQKNIILQFCRFKTWHRSCWSKIQVLAELCFILEVLRKKFIFFPFLASRGLPHLMVPYCLSSIFKVINVFSSDLRFYLPLWRLQGSISSTVTLDVLTFLRSLCSAHRFWSRKPSLSSTATPNPRLCLFLA